MMQTIKPKSAFKKKLLRIKQDRYLYLMLLPVLASFIIFHYLPYAGLQIAFKKFNLITGIWGGKWVGFSNFEKFFSSYYAGRIIKNTLVINITMAIFGFPAPIIFALMLNEVKSPGLKKTVQTVSYLPYFIPIVVSVSMLTTMTAMDTGIINKLIRDLGGQPIYFMGDPDCFLPVYWVFQIWRWCGYDAIIYISAITSIDQALYEAAEIDGAGRLRRIWHITLAGIKPTIVIMLIMRIGNLMSSDWQLILLMSNPSNESVAETIQTYVYKRGFEKQDYSYATAIGLIESSINLVLVLLANKASSLLGEDQLF